MARLSILLVYILFLGSTYAQDSSIDFIIKNVGINVDGHFNEFSITADFNDEGRLTDISSTIDVSSIETGIESRDEHILKEDYFHEEKFKQITLQSRSIKKESNSNYNVSADLTIKGKTKTVKIPVTIQKTEDGGYIITSNFEINRRDFDVGGGGFVMGKTVKIEVTHYQDLP